MELLKSVNHFKAFAIRVIQHLCAL